MHRGCLTLCFTVSFSIRILTSCHSGVNGGHSALSTLHSVLFPGFSPTSGRVFLRADGFPIYMLAPVSPTLNSKTTNRPARDWTSKVIRGIQPSTLVAGWNTSSPATSQCTPTRGGHTPGNRDLVLRITCPEPAVITRSSRPRSVSGFTCSSSEPSQARNFEHALAPGE